MLDRLIPFALPFTGLLRNDAWLDEVLLPRPPGESGMDPFLIPFLGGAIGPDGSALGGRGGLDDDDCSSRA